MLSTAAEIIEKLGGIKAVCQLTGCGYRTVWNWKFFNKFPADTFVVLDVALRRKGLQAPVALWGMRPPAVMAGRRKRAAV